jgi:ParB-like chromosome segregation protein Spo0J
MIEYKTHPLAECFPMVSASEMTNLVADIKANGLQSPIVLHHGKILDGRHRYEACLIAEIEPRFTEYQGEDPVAFVISANVSRRHLTESQRAMAAAKLETFKHGGDRKNQRQDQDANLQTTRAEAAKTLSVSPRSVASASKILEQSPRLANQVTNGKISVHAAEVQIKKEKAAIVEQLDKTGWPIPQKIQPEWDAATAAAREPMNQISKMKSAFEEAQTKQTPMFNEVVIAGAIMTCKSLYGDWKNVLPYAVCPTCQGKAPQSCGMCRRRGYVSEFFWNRCVLPEMKAMREKILAGKKACK